jgi:hypothetical protein
MSRKQQAREPGIVSLVLVSLDQLPNERREKQGKRMWDNCCCRRRRSGWCGERVSIHHDDDAERDDDVRDKKLKKQTWADHNGTLTSKKWPSSE